MGPATILVGVASLLLAGWVPEMVVAGSTGRPTPIVLWHGMGDSCCNPFSMGSVKRALEGLLPGVHVHSLMIGSGWEEDTLHGFFMPAMDQVEMACDLIGNDTNITSSSGYHALGFSQGGQFLRAVAQTCPQGMKTLVTFGAQHQGVYGLPKCLGENRKLCDYVRRLLNYGAYEPWIQDHLVQAQYWHDPLDEELYRSKSQFIAVVNNQGSHINQTYKENLTKLQKLVLIKFNNDTMVDPKGTEWFGYYRPGQAVEMIPYNETDLYTSDLIGLRQLDTEGKLDLIEVPGDHLQISNEFLAQLVDKYLRQ